MGIFGDRTYIIAEVGSNHKRDLDLAKAHIDGAKKAGADAVKFQCLSVKNQYFNPSKKIATLHEKIDFDEDWTYKLKEYADSVGIDFCSSATYLEAVDLLEDVGVKFHKIASAQMGLFPQLVEKTAKLQKPTLLSTGLVNYEEITKTIEIYKKARNNQFLLLHCNSIYPTPYEKVHLNRIEIYKKMFGNPVGFSDHTLGIHIPQVAVSLGAKVIEKHFVLDESIDTPDSKISLTAKEFALMVSNIRDIEQSLLEAPRVDIEEEELAFKEKITYKLVLKNEKKQGDTLGLDDFLYLRSQGGIDVREEGFIINNFYVKHDIDSNTKITWSDLLGKE